jgi:DNA-binding CsgD family transcriptional regulator
MELPDIASLRLRKQIDDTTKEMHDACGIDFFVIYFLFKNKDVFVLSNLYPILVEYYHHEFYKQDFSASLSLFENRDHYLCQNGEGVSDAYHTILTDKYSVHRSFYKIYHTPDFDIVVGSANKTPKKDMEKFYQKTHNDFEDFIFGFIEKNLLIFKSHNPELNSSPYFNSVRLLKTMFQQQRIKQALSPREAECLRLTARGLTADETASALQISKHTVEQHKKSLLLKLNAVNMANAIYIAMNEGFLEENGSILISNSESILCFRNLQTSMKIINSIR